LDAGLGLVIDNAVKTIQDAAAAITAAAGNQAAIDAAVAAMTANATGLASKKDELASALVANTPAAPTT
jgi:hypothetical protein